MPELQSTKEPVRSSGLDSRLCPRPENGGLQEHHEVLFLLGCTGVAEKVPEQRDVAQQRDFFLGFADLIADEAPQNNDLMIVGDHRRRDFAVVGDEINRTLNGRSQARDFLLDVEDDAVSRADPWLDLKSDSDFVTLHSLKRVDHARARR